MHNNPLHCILPLICEKVNIIFENAQLFLCMKCNCNFGECTVKSSIKCSIKQNRLCILRSVNQLVEYRFKMGNTNEMSFWKYIESISTVREKSRQEITRIYEYRRCSYSKVEKIVAALLLRGGPGWLKTFLKITTEGIEEMNDKADRSYKGKKVAVPQNFAVHIVDINLAHNERDRYRWWRVLISLLPAIRKKANNWFALEI